MAQRHGRTPARFTKPSVDCVKCSDETRTPMSDPNEATDTLIILTR